MEKRDRNDFGTWFAFDGFSALIKCVLFRSSALYLLEKYEVLLSVISSYYSLFHFGLSLVYFNPEKSNTQYDFFMKLQKIRENGDDPQKKISHKKLISILKDIGLTDFAKQLSSGKKIREFYNYGPRMTLDENRNPCFGNPLNVQEIDKLYPKDCKAFVKSIDKIIYDEFQCFLQNIDTTQLNALHGLWSKSEIYLNNESLHLKNLYSEKTIVSAKIFLRNLEDQLNTKKF